MGQDDRRRAIPNDVLEPLGAVIGLWHRKRDSDDIRQQAGKEGTDEVESSGVKQQRALAGRNEAP